MANYVGDLKDRLALFSKDVSSGRSFSAVVLIHYELIKSLQDEHYPLKLIIEAAGIDQTAKTLSKAMYRAKQRREKQGVKASNTQVTPSYQVTAPKNTATTSCQSEKHSISEEVPCNPTVPDTGTDNPTDFKEWVSVQVKSEKLINRLQKYGLSPTDVRKWQCGNETQVSNKLTSLIMTNKVTLK